MGGKPSKGTPADRRLRGNKSAKPAKPASSGSAPKFGSAAWDAKYGVGKGKKK